MNTSTCTGCGGSFEPVKLKKPVAYRYNGLHYMHANVSFCALCLEEFESGRNAVYKPIQQVVNHSLNKAA
jgi:hypothetical protein